MINVCQNYESYTQQDFDTWAELSKRQKQLIDPRVATEYLAGLAKISFDQTKIERIEEISKKLRDISGWQLSPVDGLIPTRDFFFMLINKTYPITVSIRKQDEIEFSEQPDIFHDLIGHLPLLTNEEFTKFLTAFSIIAIKYINNERAIEYLGRLYWYTYEMGVINENGELKPYGGAIITSLQEINNFYNESTVKNPFEISKIFKTPYDPYKLQSTYFVINSFQELFASIDHLEEMLIQDLLSNDSDNALRNYPLNPNIGARFNNVIGFLNDMQFKFPNVISFVAGQPDESFFQIEDHMSSFDVFVDYRSRQLNQSRTTVINKIGQYGPSKGFVNDILAQYLANDENIHVDEGSILITTGAQEAFSVVVSTICNRESDVILVEDPSYIGVSSFGKVFGYNVDGVKINNEGIDLVDLKRRIISVNESGKKVRLLYVIPDYQNPTGSCMPIGNRLKLLEMARQYNFLIIEDSVYNSFTYAQKKQPTLKSYDRYNRVVFVGSFSKSLFPGLRLGFIVADQKVENGAGQIVNLIDEMVKVKAQITNNTCGISQALLGGILIDQTFSLDSFNRKKFERYKVKRDLLIKCLNDQIKKYADSWAAGTAWDEPDGGFFIKLTVPFMVDQDTVFESASRHALLFCPMKFFYLDGETRNEMRLTFSNLSLDQIEEGVKRLAAFIQYKVECNESLMRNV